MGNLVLARLLHAEDLQPPDPGRGVDLDDLAFVVTEQRSTDRRLARDASLPRSAFARAHDVVLLGPARVRIPDANVGADAADAARRTPLDDGGPLQPVLELGDSLLQPRLLVL